MKNLCYVFIEIINVGRTMFWFFFLNAQILFSILTLQIQDQLSSNKELTVCKNCLICNN